MLFDPWVWAIGGTLIGGGGLKSAEVYIKHAARKRVPELTEDEKMMRAIEAPLTEPEKTLPEHCYLFTDRIFEKRLLDSGVIKREEMSICEDGVNCPECGPDARYKQNLIDMARKREQLKRDAEAEVARRKLQAAQEKSERERREREHRERMARYENEKWHAVKDETGRITGHIKRLDNGDYMYESMVSGKRKVIRKADARRYCKKCWQPLRRNVGSTLGTCPRGCEQEIPEDRIRVIEGYQVMVPEKVPFDAFGKIDREYPNRDGIYAVMWKWINPGNGKAMAFRSLHAKSGEYKVTAIDEAGAGRVTRPKVTHIKSTTTPSTTTSGDFNKTYMNYKRQIEEYERKVDELERRIRKY